MYPIPGLTGTIEVTIPTPVPADPSDDAQYPFPALVMTTLLITPLLTTKSACAPYPCFVFSMIETVVLEPYPVPPLTIPRERILPSDATLTFNSAPVPVPLTVAIGGIHLK